MKWKPRKLKYDPLAEYSGYQKEARKRVRLCIQDDLMTYKDAGIFLRMNPKSLRVYKHRGLLTGERIGKIFLLHGASVRSYMQANAPEELQWWLEQKPDILTGSILEEMNSEIDV